MKTSLVCMRINECGGKIDFDIEGYVPTSVLKQKEMKLRIEELHGKRPLLTFDRL